jgi:putative redox protein
MKQRIEADWKGMMQFEAELNGHKIVIDAPESSGGEDKGPRPKPLMLLALAGCTGMDVVSILKKMRVPLDDFKVSVEGDMTEEHPKHYQSMHLVYRFFGQDLDPDKLKKSIELSMANYCGVSAVYRKAMEVSWEMKINE